MQNRTFKKITIWLGLCLALAGSATAQSTATNEHKGQGYGFAAPVVTNSGDAGLQIGGGGERLIYRGLGAGAEVSYLGTVRGLRDGFGVFSPNVSYHFLSATKSGKWVPFVTGGYTLYFRSGVAHGFNFGGGVNYWFKERVGLRFEARDQVFANNGAAHLVSLRAGISFR